MVENDDGENLGLSHSYYLCVYFTAGKIKASALRSKNKTELVKQLEDLKKELSEVSKKKKGDLCVLWMDVYTKIQRRMPWG